MSVLWITVAAVALAIGAVGALIASRARVGAIAPFSAVGLMAGVSAISAGSEDAGFALIAAAAMLTLMAYAAGALVGDRAPPRRKPPRVAAAVAVVTLGVLGATWLFAPPIARPAPPHQLAAFGLARGLDLFVALAALVGVAGAAASLLGFGERGVLGVPREGPR